MGVGNSRKKAQKTQKEDKLHHKADFAPHTKKIINRAGATSAKDTKVTKVGKKLPYC